MINLNIIQNINVCAKNTIVTLNKVIQVRVKSSNKTLIKPTRLSLARNILQGLKRNKLHWIFTMVDTYCAEQRRGKYPPLATDTEVISIHLFLISSY